jgi:hypothetical protein
VGATSREDDRDEDESGEQPQHPADGAEQLVSRAERRDDEQARLSRSELVEVDEHRGVARVPELERAVVETAVLRQANAFVGGELD